MENQVEKAQHRHAPTSMEGGEASFEGGSAMQLQTAEHPNVIAQRKVQAAANSSWQSAATENPATCRQQQCPSSKCAAVESSSKWQIRINARKTIPPL